jgi:exosome complex exonuclease DIS3/RRP44
VKFATYKVRDNVFRSKKNLKDVNTAQPDESGQGRMKVFINEDLTKKRSTLLWNARKMKKDQKIQDCWTWDGTVLVKDNAAKIFPIHSYQELLTHCV